jgi:hypothetical protein
MSYVSPAPSVAEERAPFPGHPFGGLIREDRFGRIATLDNPLSQMPVEETDGDKLDALDATGGFDFHLGVYSRF